MTRLVPFVAALAGAGALLSAGVAAAEIKPGQQEGLGLTARDVPELLQRAKADPYAAPANCDAAYAELAELDRLLGPDANEPEAQPNQAGNLLVKGVRSLIPHREVFRMLTGVEKKERELTEAAMAGWARRGFIKATIRKDCHAAEAGTAPVVASAEVAPPAAEPQALQPVVETGPYGNPAVDEAVDLAPERVAAAAAVAPPAAVNP
ncbi:hypothetical protein [Phenylobacterium sp.]|jgi:hypothetical protein|uniref:hypothetical protein n=1 Tax=Phenylobacterium sp. TaxID=1871053 RepID=UPI0037836BA6